MPLEQLRGGAATARSDQFALCVCLWEALIGARPWPTGGTIASLVIAMREPPRRPARHRRVLAVLARGLDPDPDRRWPDVAALCGALDRARTRTRQRAIAAITAAIVALGTAAALLATGRL